MESEDRYRKALEKINSLRLPISYGIRIKEIIRRAFYPNEPCPHCSGTGKIPNPEGICCSSCKSFHEYPMSAGGSCESWATGKSVREHDSCNKHEFQLAILSCNACSDK